MKRRTSTRGVSWDSGVQRLRVLLAMAMALALVPLGSSDATSRVDVIVREAQPSSQVAEAAVQRVGGTVGEHLSIIGGFAASIPESALIRLASDPSIDAVTPDASVELMSTSDWAADTATYRSSGSMYKTAKFIHARSFWDAGYTGAGVDVALIDSGVAPVDGLLQPGKVVDGPDLSFESQNPEFRHLDTYGHGTHMAGIIAGSDDGIVDPWTDAKTHFVGIAPNARIISVKVAGHDGAVDVSQMIAAIDWVVQHRHDNGMNIRVLNLSFGTDSAQTALLDPLSFAVEQAWKAGIVVVVAAGNDGGTIPLRMPAANPFVVAVGAYDSNGTNITGDDYLTTFTNCGVGRRTYDVLAPGRSILSLRNPGSTSDLDHPDAVVDGRLFRGTGTSQAAAVVSGAVALMLEQRPALTPDQVKELLTSTADHLGRIPPPGCPRKAMVDLREIAAAPTPSGRQIHTAATGLGSLDASRGSDRLTANGSTLGDERDIHGRSWNAAEWARQAAQGVSWSGGDWNGVSWSGTTWSGVSWSGVSWSGVSWSGTTWSGTTWSGTTWSDMSWTGVSWSGRGWSGTTWSGTTWSGSAWQ